MSISLATLRKQGVPVTQVITNRMKVFNEKDREKHVIGLGALAARDARKKGY